MRVIRDFVKNTFQFDLSHLDDKQLYELATRVLTTGPIGDRTFEEVYETVEEMAASMMLHLTHLISDEDMRLLFDEMKSFEEKNNTGSK